MGVTLVHVSVAVLLLILTLTPAKSMQRVDAYEGSDVTLTCQYGSGLLQHHHHEDSSSSEENEWCEFKGPRDQTAILEGGKVVKEYHRHFTYVGKCSVTLPKVESRDRGLWSCRLYSGDRHRYNFDTIMLHVYREQPTTMTPTPDPTTPPPETPVRIVDQSKSVEARDGSRADLWVRVNREVVVCRWLGPQGQDIQFQRRSDTQDDGRYAYSQGAEEEGFEDGFCRLRVSHTSLMDHGIWRAQVFPKHNHSLHTKIALHVYNQGSVE